MSDDEETPSQPPPSPPPQPSPQPPAKKQKMRGEFTKAMQQKLRDLHTAYRALVSKRSPTSSHTPEMIASAEAAFNENKQLLSDEAAAQGVSEAMTSVADREFVMPSRFAMYERKVDFEKKQKVWEKKI